MCKKGEQMGIVLMMTVTHSIVMAEPICTGDSK
ncbi:hypothetical protein TSL6_15620 [Sulfurovum sp. TSL6]|nr:hypothetical protein TSL6_15620 [Sulfurovum sp. TSL6]